MFEETIHVDAASRNPFRVLAVTVARYLAIPIALVIGFYNTVVCTAVLAVMKFAMTF